MFRNSAFESVGCSESEPSWHLVFFPAWRIFASFLVKFYCTVLRGASQVRETVRETTYLPQKDASCLAGNTVWSIWSTNGILHRWYLGFGVMVVNVLKGLFEWLHLWKTNMEPFGTGGLWRCVSFAMWWHLFGLVVSFCLKHRNPRRVMKCYQQIEGSIRDQLGGSWYSYMLVTNKVLQYYPGPPLSCRLVFFVFFFEKNAIPINYQNVLSESIQHSF